MPNNPSPQLILRARLASGLSQTKAAALVWCQLRAWQQWEAGQRKMQIGLFELFCIKTFQTEIFNRFEKSNDAPNA